MDWRSGFIIASILQGAVLAILLLRIRERPANAWLAATLAAIIGMVIVYPLGWHGRNEVPVWLAFLPVNLPLALGPLIHAHAKSIAQSGRPAIGWLHFAPAAIQLLYLCALSVLPLQLSFAWKETIHDDIVKPLIEVSVLVSLASYAAASLILLRSFRARLLRLRSDADLHDARWLGRLLGTLLVSLGVLCAVRLYTSFVDELEGGLHLLWLSIWCAWLGIEGWRVAGVPPPALAEDPVATEPERRVQDWHALGQAWQARTREAGWWREPDLTLAELARRVGTNTLYLSRAINEGLGMNFNEMINRLRSEEVARTIDASAAANDLLPVALDAGFSSKATFNRAFRAAYGMTPSEYRRRRIS